MNIAYVNADAGIPLFSTKGAAVHVRDFAGAATRLGHAVRVFTAKAGTPPATWAVPYEVVEASASSQDLPEDRGLRLNTALRAALARDHQRGAFDVIYERYSLWSHSSLNFARRRGLPYVLEVNSPLVVEQSTYRSLSRQATARRIERYLFGAATRIVTVSREVADYVCAHGADPARVVVAVNGVDLSLYADVQPPSTDDTRFTIGFLGSLKPWHGIDVLIDALELLVSRSPHYHLRLIGDGPERARLTAQIAERGLSAHTTVVGQVARDQVPVHLHDVDVTVAPYPRLDGFYFSPLKVFEYMAAGRPIVASRIGQIESVLEDQQTALLVTPGDPGRLADAIETLRRQPALAARLSRAARDQALSRHGWEHTVATALSGVEGQL
ncbi:MAG: glycosyltransferase family 4 protein [Vicinamibacterales bacterium]